MDISSLLSPQPSPLDSPQPPSPPPSSMQSPRKQMRRNPPIPNKSATPSSPLARSSITPSNLPQHVATHCHRPAAPSPLASPTAGVLPNASSPRALEAKRQSSTPGMDTLADLASLQNHQPTRSAAPSFRSKDTFETQL